MKLLPLLFASACFFLADAQRDACNNPLDPTSDEYGSDATGYGEWLSSTASLAPYNNTLFIPTASDECSGMAFHWKIVDKKKIKIAMAVKVSQARGGGEVWAAVGFSETGGMKGADVVYFKSSTNEIVDAHVGDAYMSPKRDIVSQDWTLLHAEVSQDGYIIFEAERDLITAENPGHEDHNIVDDSSIYVTDHKIIGAWGVGSTVSYHGRNVVQRSVQLFPGPNGEKGGDGFAAFLREMEARADGSANLALNNYQIPSDETTYHETCFTVNELVDLGLYQDSKSDTYVIGFEYLIDKATVKYLHHMVIYGHFSSWNTDPSRCLQWARSTIAAWAPGDDTLYFPDGAGLKIGNVPNSFNAITIQYHFDNPDGDRNQIDNGSGVRIYFAGKDSVKHEVGMYTVGDANLDLDSKPVGDGKTKHEITCPSKCSANSLFVDEVTVVAELHHMHAKGKRLVNELFSEDGSTIRNTATVDYWDFDQNGAVYVRQDPYIMRKGDYYKTTCFFESYDGTEFGLGSSDEMCMVFIYYYPRYTSLFTCSPEDFNQSCRSDYRTTTLPANSNFERPVSETMSPTETATRSPTLKPTAYPTTSPSVSPTKTPTVSQTLNPTAFPTTAPTASPTMVPTAERKPTSSDYSTKKPTSSSYSTKKPTVVTQPPSPSCVDSPLMFIAQGIPRHCEWVGENPEERCNEMWARGARAKVNIKSHCPVSCGECENYGCSDTIGSFILDDGTDGFDESRECCWLNSLNEEMRKAMCSENHLQRTCQKTCDFCSDSHSIWGEEEVE